MMAGPHPSEEVVERYCLGRLPAAESESFEEHLLICGQCRNRLRESERFVQSMRNALAAAGTATPGRRWSRPRVLWAGGLAALAVVAILVLIWPTAGGRPPQIGRAHV